MMACVRSTQEEWETGREFWSKALNKTDLGRGGNFYPILTERDGKFCV